MSSQHPPRFRHCIATIVVSATLLLYAGSGHAAPFAYIPNYGSNNVSVIDIASNTVVATIPTGCGTDCGRGPNAVAVNSAGTAVYVITQNALPIGATNNGTVVEIDATTNGITNYGASGGYPLSIAFDPAGTFAYISAAGGLQGSVIIPPDVEAINTATQAVTSIAIGVSGAIAVNPAGTFAYLTGRYSQAVFVIDTATKTVVTGPGLPIAVGSGPVAIAVGANGRAYVANSGSGTVSVFNTATNAVTATIPVGVGPSSIAVNPAGTLAYVANQTDGTVSVIDTATNAVVGPPIVVGSHPYGISVSPGGNLIYVANSSDNTVSVIAEPTRAAIGVPIAVGLQPSPLGQFIKPGAAAVGPPTKLATYVGPAPTVGLPFKVVVQAQDATSAPQNVAASTSVTLSRTTGTGNPSGTLGCTIPAGSSACTLAAVVYSVAETGVVLTATRTTGDALPPGNSGPFRMFPVAPTKLAVTAINAGANPVRGKPFDVTVETRNDGEAPTSVIVDTAVTLSRIAGSGTLGGTLGCTITAGTSACTIVGVTYSKAEVEVAIRAARTSGNVVTAADAGPFTVNTPASPTNRLVITSINGGAHLASGVAFNVVVQAQDAAGTPVNLVSGSGVLLQLKAGTGLFGGNRTCTITAGTNSCTASASYTPGDASVGETGVVINASSTNGQLGAVNSPPLIVDATTTPPGGPPTRLSLAPLGFFNDSEPAAGVPFAVAVGAFDQFSFRPVVAATAITLSVQSGTGTLGGTLGCTIPAGSTICLMAGVTYSKGESGVVLRASRTSGDVLTAGDGEAFVVHAAAPPTKLVVTEVGEDVFFGDPVAVAGAPFPVRVKTQDAGGVVQNVSAPTGVALSVKTGTGTLGGTVSCTIPAGSSSCVVTATTYSKVETGIVLTATRTSGPTLTAGDSAAFEIGTLPTKLAISSVSPNENPKAGFAFSVYLGSQDASGTDTAVATATTVGLTIAAGTGALGGNTSCTIPAGSSSCAIFGVTYSQPESGVVLTAARVSGDVLSAANTAPINVDAAPPIPAARLAVTKVNGGAHPAVAVPFNVTVGAEDMSGTAESVASGTAVVLSLHAGTGVLGGTLGCTIALDQNSCTVVGVTYSKAETGVALTATRTSGDVLVPGNSAPFTVDAIAQATPTPTKTATKTPTPTATAPTPTPTATQTVPPTGATAVPTPVPTPSPHGDAKAFTKCRAAIAAAGAALLQAETKALRTCAGKVVGGKLPPATVCRTETKAAATIAKARAKLGTTIAKSCGGKDKSCGAGGDDLPLAEIGWAIDACPDIADGACGNPIADCGGIAACLTCIDEAAVDRAIALSYDALSPTDPKDKTQKALNKCQSTIGSAAAGFLVAKSAALTKCWQAVNKGKASGACPAADGKAEGAITKAELKLSTAICKACSGPDKTCGNADDPAPSEIGFVPACLPVTPPGSASCAGAIAAVPDIVGCVGCVTELTVDCATAAAVPAFAAYPTECHP